jgi:hypothetical protein
METILILSEKEKSFYQELKKVPCDSIWGLAIKNVLANPTPERFEHLIKELKSQTADCAETMMNILGESCFFKLINL